MTHNYGCLKMIEISKNKRIIKHQRKKPSTHPLPLQLCHVLRKVCDADAQRLGVYISALGPEPAGAARRRPEAPARGAGAAHAAGGHGPASQTHVAAQGGGDDPQLALSADPATLGPRQLLLKGTHLHTTKHNAER